MSTTFKVRFWEIKKRAGRKRPYGVRWVTETKEHSEWYVTKALATSRLSELSSAARAGEPFDVDTGLPLSELRRKNSFSFLEFSWSYMDMKWPDAAAKTPAHDEIKYSGDNLPVWDVRAKGFVDPQTRRPLPTWEDALDQVEHPAHVARFGVQVHSKGILGGTEEAGRHIGYLTKYLTKSINECYEAQTARQEDHAERLCPELAVTPCSPQCAVWLLYGVQPRGARLSTVPGRCKGKAHKRTTLGVAGRRVLVSRKWSGKSLADHKHDRKAFVRQLLADVGIKPEDQAQRVVWNNVQPGDPNVPPRAHLLLTAVAERRRWKAEYTAALLASAGPPESSATHLAA